MAATAVLAGAGAFMQGVGAMQAGESSAAASEYNALLADYNAGVTELITKEEVRRLRVQGRKVLGDARANYGASGVTAEGSALDVLQESAAAVETDALFAQYKGDVQAANYRNQGRLDRYNARAARRAGRIGAVTAFLGGANSAVKKG